MRPCYSDSLNSYITSRSVVRGDRFLFALHTNHLGSIFISLLEAVMQDRQTWEIEWRALFSWSLILSAFFPLSLASVVPCR